MIQIPGIARGPEQFRFGEILAQVLEGEQVDFAVTPEKESADEDQHQSAKEDRPESREGEGANAHERGG